MDPERPLNINKNIDTKAEEGTSDPLTLPPHHTDTTQADVTATEPQPTTTTSNTATDPAGSGSARPTGVEGDGGVSSMPGDDEISLQIEKVMQSTTLDQLSLKKIRCVCVCVCMCIIIYKNIYYYIYI
eukprot:GHVR01192424.1.p1 GENE.GHVR01192424.1~~GHVR01192424.1.p1  ORF type:complete len:128 (-),score=43.31 GHVR01192424.1:34-417(-)